MTDPVEVPTYWVEIHMAGDLATAKQLLRRECYPPNPGLCVTVRAESFIYTGGEEEGFVVGLLNYPRFPTTPDALWERAKAIAARLVAGCCQRTALLKAPDRTAWLPILPPDQPGGAK